MAALFLGATSVFAQNEQTNVPHPIAAFRPSQVTSLAQPTLTRDGMRMTRRRTPITGQPEGKLIDNMLASYGGYQRNWLYGLMDVSTDGGVSKIVEAEDGELYIYNLPSTLDAGTWVRAQRTEGDTVLIKRQHIDQYDDNGTVYDYYLTRVVWQWTDKEAGEGVFVEAEGDTDMKLLYHDGVLESIDENKDPFQEGSYALGAVYTTNGKTFTWEGATVWNLRFEALTDQPLSLPEGAKTEKITVTFESNGQTIADQTDVAFVGNDVYLNFVFPGVYIKGTIDGDKLRFKSGQYLGIYYNRYHIFFVGQRYTTVHDEATGQDVNVPEIIDELVFDYNPADRSFKTDDALVLNVGRRTTRLQLQALNAPSFYFFQEKPTTPADPEIVNYSATFDDYGYNALQFSISTTDVDGNYIVPEKLSWMAYIDDEPFIFSRDEYEGLTEDMEEIPYGFYNSGFDIYTSFFTFFFQPAKNVGMQTIYRGAGEERRSNIVLYDIKTSQIYTIATGIQKTETDSPAVDVTYHDVAGRLTTGNARGLLLKTVRRADGSVTTQKIIKR